ncbi:MAG: hypothetical protein PVJ57_06080 [Phycisphaerae bacterium]
MRQAREIRNRVFLSVAGQEAPALGRRLISRAEVWTLDLGNPLYDPLILIGVHGSQQIPAPVRRELCAVRLITAVLLFGAIFGSVGAFVVSRLTSVWVISPWIVWLWMIVFPAWLFTVPPFVARKFAKRLREARYRVCMTCGHCLLGLPQQHVCPERGSAYEYERLTHDWRAWLKTVNLDQE